MSSLSSVVRKSSSISATEFYNAFHKSWLSRVERPLAEIKDVDQVVHNIAVAVSGGSDSMALAYLLKHFKEQEREGALGRFEFTAFIVDHKIRESGDREIIKTRLRLKQMGLHPHVIPLDWPAGVSPSTLSNLETHARRLRYQALGKACREKDIKHLLMAHHSDDQAETVLMNLAASQAGVRLGGMARQTNIPECYGIHGVHESGSYERAARQRSRFQHRHVQQADPISKKHLIHLHNKSPVFESGGVEIIRPLLEFSKERLRQTCQDNSIDWEEDKSNHDVSVTPRNTVRSLLSSARLPRALGKASLLRISNTEFTKRRLEARVARQLQEKTELLMLDVRSGVLIIRFQSNILRLRGICKAVAGLVATHYLKEFVQAVSPQADIALTSIAGIANTIFQGLEDPHIEPTRGDEELTFTAGGVYFRRRHNLKKALEETSQRPDPGYDDCSDPEFIWILHRQPFPKLQVPQPLIILPSASIPTTKLASSERSTTSPINQNRDRGWSAWQMWDGRYWLRIRNQTSRNLFVRAWKASEMSAIQGRVTPSTFGRFRKALKVAAPGVSRWTLPVIAEAGTGGKDVEGDNASAGDGIRHDPRDFKHGCSELGKILVFPTLGKAGWLDIVDEEGRRKLEWEVRYKRVTLKCKDQDGNPMRYDPTHVHAWDNGGQGEVTLNALSSDEEE